MIAVDADSNQISVLGILPGGLLALVRGGVVPSAGVQPLSVAVHGKLVYVANVGTGGSNYTGFRLTPAGRLAPVPGSTVALPSGSQPGDVLFNGTGTKLAGTRVETSQIDSFTVGPDARLTAAPGSPFPAQGLDPLGSEFRPTNPDQLFVSNATTPPSTAAGKPLPRQSSGRLDVKLPGPDGRSAGPDGRSAGPRRSWRAGRRPRSKASSLPPFGRGGVNHQNM